MYIDVRPLLRRILIAGVPLMSAACPCPEPTVSDQVFLLDSRADGGLLGDAGMEAGVGEEENCLPAAMGCAPDGNCLPACTCVLSRARISYSEINRCTLLAGAGVPSVQARYSTLSGCPGGRRPHGYAARCSSPDAVVAYLTSLAELEAASILAFDVLGWELRAHGAPETLVRRARRARRDEARHWRLMAAAAAAHGGHPRAPRLPRAPAPRTLDEVLRENAVEGCVQETYGALLAAFQGASAHDPTLRAAFSLLADDEAGHAQLAWDVQAWGRPRLATAARRRLDRARHAAAEALATSAAAPVDARLRHLAGLPSPDTAAMLVARARELLWS